MAKSEISQFQIITDELVSGSSTGNIVILSDTERPYEFSIDIEDSSPVPDTSKIIFSYNSSTSIDDDGTEYFGVFQIDADNISVTGSNLTEDQKTFIKNKLGLTSQNQNEVLLVNVKEIGSNAISEFSLNIPFVETLYNPGSFIVTDNFINLNATSSNLDQVQVLVSSVNKNLTIQSQDQITDRECISIGSISSVPDESYSIDITGTSSNRSMEITQSKDFSSLNVMRLFDSFQSYTLIDTTVYGTISNPYLSNIFSRMQSGKSADILIISASREPGRYRSASPGLPADSLQTSCFSGIIIDTNLTQTTDDGTVTSVTNCVASATVSKLSSSNNFTFSITGDNSLKSGIALSVTQNMKFNVTSGQLNILNNSDVLLFSTSLTAGKTFDNIKDEINADLDLEGLVVARTYSKSRKLPSNLLNSVSGGGTIPGGNTGAVLFTATFSYSESLTISGSTKLIDVLNFMKNNFDGKGAVTIPQDSNTSTTNWINTVPAKMITIDPSASVGLTRYPILLNTVDTLLFNEIIFMSSLPPLDTLQDVADFINTNYLSGKSLIMSPETGLETTNAQAFISSFIPVNLEYSVYQRCVDDGSTNCPRKQVSGSALSGIAYTGSSSTDSSISYDLNALTIQSLSNNINSDWTGLITSSVLNGLGSENASIMNNVSSIDITGSFANLQCTIIDNIIQDYDFSNYTSGINNIQEIVDDINSFWNTYNVFASNQSDLNDARYNLDNLNSLSLTSFSSNSINLSGSYSEITNPVPPVENLKLDYNLIFANETPPPDSSISGLQIAFGGIETEFASELSEAPNAYFELGFNTFSPIEFVTSNANVIYLLLRSRVGVNNPTYETDPSSYSARVTFSDNSPGINLSAFTPSSSSQTSSWDETGLSNDGFSGLPAVIAIPANSSIIDISVNDNFLNKSSNIRIFNFNKTIDSYGFLAINRSNQNRPQKKSKDVNSFGLVLDSIGAWDILISPDASLEQTQDGNFSYLNNFYTRTVTGSDEKFEYSISNFDSLPEEVQNAISIKPINNYSEVGVLSISPELKKYLFNQLIESSNEEDRQDNCSLSIDLSILGKLSNRIGSCRVTIYYDAECTFNISLCDYVFNLSNPPEPSSGSEIIQNNLVVTYSQLLNCGNISQDDTLDNIRIDLPLLFEIENIPTLENGNSLLLIKSKYTAEVKNFFLPTNNDINLYQDDLCKFLKNNVALVRFLNKRIMELPSGEILSTNTDIENRVLTEPSYLIRSPLFQFPPIDTKNKDCGSSEIVIMGIGYEYKNWTFDSRKDNFLIGVELLISNEVFSGENIEFCYRYYYNEL